MLTQTKKYKYYLVNRCLNLTLIDVQKEDDISLTVFFFTSKPVTKTEINPSK